MFVNNNDILNIDNINITTEIFYGDILPMSNHNKSQFNQFLLGDVPQDISSFILNDKILRISIGFMLSTICRSFIFDSKDLSMSTMLVSQ